MEHYLVRIGLYENTLNAAITVNADALESADERDRERAKGRLGGPLPRHPDRTLKDNIHITDMPTTGGALAFDGFVPSYEATLTKNLRAAGPINHREDRAAGAGELGGGGSHAYARQLQRDRGLRP